MTTDRELVWASFADSVKAEIGRSTKPPADVACEILGLDWESNIAAVALEFPAHFFESVHVPTVIDGGVNPLFCVWSVIDDEVGYTWRLDTQSKGLPEVVFQHVYLNSQATITDLGRTQNNRRSTDWVAFLRYAR